MTRTYLTEFIMRSRPMPEETAAAIAAHFEPVTYQKNDFLLQQGQICSDYIIMETGIIRAFTHDTEGDEVTTGFYETGSVVFEVASYFKRTPTQENFQALTDCTGWKGEHTVFQVLFHSIPEFREFGRSILVSHCTTLKERSLSMIRTTAEQRYAQLMETQPELLQQAPLKHIASYLGITDTSLSRIRKELSRKKHFLPNDKQS